MTTSSDVRRPTARRATRALAAVLVGVMAVLCVPVTPVAQAESAAKKPPKHKRHRVSCHKAKKAEASKKRSTRKRKCKAPKKTKKKATTPVPKTGAVPPIPVPVPVSTPTQSGADSPAGGSPSPGSGDGTTPPPTPPAGPDPGPPPGPVSSHDWPTILIYGERGAPDFTNWFEYLAGPNGQRSCNEYVFNPDNSGSRTTWPGDANGNCDVHQSAQKIGLTWTISGDDLKIHLGLLNQNETIQLVDWVSDNDTLMVNRGGGTGPWYGCRITGNPIGCP